MQYNLTPLLNVEQMIRSLYPVRRLRDDYGLTISHGDAVRRQRRQLALRRPAAGGGIELLTMAVNQLRGRAPKPMPAAFWWEGPAGGKVLAWNGFHYLFGRSSPSSATGASSTGPRRRS